MRRSASYALALLAAFVLATLIPDTPFGGATGADTSDGSPVRRILTLALLAAAAVVALDNRVAARRLLARHWVGIAALVWITASLAWADHPGIALRRIGFLWVTYLTVVALVSGLPSARRTHLVVAGTLLAIVAVDVLGVILVPHLAVEPLGARGMHGQKNTAGAVAMMALVFLVPLLPTMRRAGPLALLLAAAAMAAGFLLLTNSKTSIVLLAATVALLLPFAASLAFGRILGIVLLGGTGVAAGLLLVSLGALGWGLPEVLEAVTGDRTFTGRTDIWAFVWSHITNAPLLGTGYGAFWDVGEAHDPLRHAPSWLGTVDGGIINQAHNGYLDLWLQAGFPALVAVVVLLVRGAAVAGLVLVRARDLETWAAAAAMFSFIIMLSVYNLMETALLSRVHPFNGMFLLALIVVEKMKLEQEDTIHDRP